MKKLTPETALEFVRENVAECDISYRGGTLKVNVREIFPDVYNPVMGAYQNYLGGGIAGRIVGAAMFEPTEIKTQTGQANFQTLIEACATYFHEVNHGGGDDYMQENYGGYEFNQNLPIAAY